MHDVLYREQGVWSKADDVTELFDAYAGTIGLKVDQFKKDIDSEQAKQRVESDQARANLLGVKSTPTIFVNNREISPEQKTPDGLRVAIKAALEEKPEQK